MNLLQKIRNYLDQKKALNELYDDISNFNEVLLDQRIAILEEVVTAKFAEIGLKNWNGKYIWFSDFNEEGIKHVIEYNVFKGFGGSFSFGNCYDFIPTFSNKTLINHKTDKSTAILFYNRLEGWQKSYEINSRINPDRISTVNEKKFRSTLNLVLNENLSKLKKWFDENKTLDQNIESLYQKIENPPYEIGQRIISNEYLLSFFMARKNNFNESQKWINKHFDKKFNDEKVKLLILKKLSEFKN